jgi:hypothetical protein
MLKARLWRTISGTLHGGGLRATHDLEPGLGGAVQSQPGSSGIQART